MPTPPDLTAISNQIIAVGALGTAAFGLVDSTKVLRGGISNRGFGYIQDALTPFAPALEEALGVNPAHDWRSVMRSHWINGRPKEEQKAIAASLIQLGLTAENAPALAEAGQVAPAALQAVVAALDHGQELTPEQLNILGRFKATIEARVDAAYERADQVYRNSARFLAGIVAIMLAVTAAYVLYDVRTLSGFGPAILIGVVAVPLAPIARDIASALAAAAHALGRRLGP